jgi:hypothetical protein
MARQLALIGVVVVASLALIAGLASLPVQSPAGGSASPVPSASRAASPSRSSMPSTTASADPGSPGPSPSVADAVLIGAGNIADCRADESEATAHLLDQLQGTVFTAGDNAAPDGSATAFADCYGPTWGPFRERTRPAAGDQDWATKDLAGYLGYFGRAAAPDGVSWYSYPLGAWHVVVLDSDCEAVGGCGSGSDQGRWLAADLKADRSTCLLAIWHLPRFSSGRGGDTLGVAPLWEAVSRAGGDVVVSAHDADYERFAPLGPDGEPDRDGGVRSFVVGTGGAPLAGFGTPRPGSAFRLGGAHGILRLGLHPTSYDWTFIPTSGGPTDSGKADCH